MSNNKHIDVDGSVYRELQCRIDALPIPYPKTESGVELRLLEHLFDKSEAAVASNLSALSEPLIKIQRRLMRKGIEHSDSTLTNLLDGLVERGAITSGVVVSRKQRVPGYSLMPLAVGMFEMQVDRLDIAYARDFEEYLDTDFGRCVLPKGSGQLRTVPVHTAIETSREVGTYDDIRSYINTIKGPFGVMNCVCRQTKDLFDEHCDHGDIRETCLTIGGSAIGMKQRGAARLVKREEFLDILDRAEKKGFVIQPQNTRNPEYICCCCGDCCELLSTAKKFPRPVEVFHSNYRAVVDAGLCNGCSRCVKRCQMDAIVIEDNVAVIDYDRCIGCGLCISTCPSDSMSLEPKQRLADPPRSFSLLMARMYLERKGLLKTVAWLARVLFKAKV